MINSAIYLPQELIKNFRESLQWFYDFSQEHGAEFTLIAVFIPDSDFKFARLTFLAEDGKIIPKAMRY